MKSWLSVSWRLLLAIALVANPIAAAFASCHETMDQATAPPCHHAADKRAASLSPLGQHDHDCARSGCDFGACCGTCVLAAATIAPELHLPPQLIGHGQGAYALAGPPLPPLIRPPIA